MKRRQFIAGASAASAIGLPGMASAAPEVVQGVLSASPECLGYSKQPAAWIGRSVVLQIGDGLGNWQTVQNLKPMVLDTKEFA